MRNGTIEQGGAEGEGSTQIGVSTPSDPVTPVLEIKQVQSRHGGRKQNIQCGGSSVT